MPRIIQLAIASVSCLNFANIIFALVLLSLIHPTTAYDAGSLPLVSDQSICAIPPGTSTTNGLDDVCLLATTCCPSWTNIPGTMTLSSNTPISCASAICTNICHMACDHVRTPEACTGTPLCEVTTTTEAYIFIRCTAAAGVGHPGFGFLASPGLYFYSRLKNPQSNLVLLPGSDNGFWMWNGSQNDMFCMMKSLPVGSDMAYDDKYKVFMNTELANLCAGMSMAEGVYGSGYAVTLSNSLDVVFHILTAYGITGFLLPSDQIFPNIWYNSLNPNTFIAKTMSEPLTGCTSPAPIMSCSATATLAPQPMPGLSPGCTACEAGLGCCLLDANLLVLTCVCGAFEDCSSFGGSSGAVFCPSS